MIDRILVDGALLFATGFLLGAVIDGAARGYRMAIADLTGSPAPARFPGRMPTSAITAPQGGGDLRHLLEAAA